MSHITSDKQSIVKCLPVKEEVCVRDSSLILLSDYK